MIIRPLMTCLLVLAALLVSGGCTKRETPADAGIRTQTLLIGNLAEPRDLDPHVVTAATDMNILIGLFEGLTVLDEKTSQALPGVASSWDPSDDGLVWTFHLRPDARWSNGDPVTSHDFAYAFRRILSPAMAAEYSYMLWPIKNAEAYNAGKITDFSSVGIATPDNFTLQVTLERPTPYLPALAGHTTWLPVHRGTIEKHGRMDQPGTTWTRPGNLVGNGPFQLSEWTPNARIVLDKNPRYWDAATTRLQHIIFFPTENPDVEERNFRAGQLHITFDLPSSKIPVYQRESPRQLRLDALLNIWYLNFNTTKPPLDNPLVRQALALAVDREAISRSVYNGAFRAAQSFVPPDCGGYVSTTHTRTDVAEARRLLAEAGYPGGRGLPVLSVQALNNDKLPKVAEALQGMWKKELGVNVTIEPSEQKIWIQTQTAMNHTIGLMGWVADFADPVTFLQLRETGNGNNWSGWSNPAYDRLLQTAANTADAQARFALFQQAETLLLNEAAASPLVYGARTYLINPAVKNWDSAPLGLHQYKKVYLEP